ncbi:hypothetical protein [Kitasatospora indigofera]|uniref:hypothetical protein n=1 Tax=Kitasatospora indigofera TaxID=67307 RepID=UPI0033BEB578
MASGTVLPEEAQAGEPVRDVVRSVIAALAPEELPLVDGLRRFDDATVVRRLNGRGLRREPLGFGIGEVAALVTPVVWLVLDGVAQRMVSATVDRVAQGTAGALRRLLRRPAPAAQVPPLTREQLAEVRALVLAAAGQRDFPPGRAAEIADAVVARLALSVAPDPPAPRTARAPAGPVGPDSPAEPEAPPALPALPALPAPPAPDAPDAPGPNSGGN